MAVFFKLDSDKFIAFIPKHYVGQMIVLSVCWQWAITNLEYYKTLCIPHVDGQDFLLIQTHHYICD